MAGNIYYRNLKMVKDLDEEEGGCQIKKYPPYF